MLRTHTQYLPLKTAQNISANRKQACSALEKVESGRRPKTNETSEATYLVMRRQLSLGDEQGKGGL